MTEEEERSLQSLEDLAAKKERAKQLRNDFQQFRHSARYEKAQFAIIYEGFLPFLNRRRGQDEGLTSTDVKLYLYLCLRANKYGESWYGIERMAEDLGIGRRTVQRSLVHLERQGLIERLQLRGLSTRTFLRPYDLRARTTDETQHEEEL